jgi:hypothetical protein
LFKAKNKTNPARDAKKQEKKLHLTLTEEIGRKVKILLKIV